MAKVLGLNIEEMTFQAPGVNHRIWMTHFIYRGKDAYPLLDEWIETKAEEYWRTWDGVPTYDREQMSRFAFSLYKMFGLFQIGDIAKYAGAWWVKEFKDGSESTWENYTKSLKKRLDKMFELYANSSMLVTKEFTPVSSVEQHIPIIDALVNEHEGKFQVNIPNKGVLKGLADDVVVEVPALVSGRGVQALQVGSLPKNLTLHILRTSVLPMEQSLEAYLSRDKRVLLSNILTVRGTKSYEEALGILEDVLADYEDLRRHFKVGDIYRLLKIHFFHVRANFHH